MKETAPEIFASLGLVAAASALGALAVPRSAEAVMPEQPAAVIKEQDGPAALELDTKGEPYNPPGMPRGGKKHNPENRAPFRRVYGRKGAQLGNRKRGDVGGYRR